MTGSLDPRSVGLLREAVLRHRETEPRRRFVPRLHVGVPGRRTAVHEVRGDEDQAARTDLVAAMVEPFSPGVGVARPDLYAWLTRPGHLTLHDLDADWSVAVRDACAQVGLDAVFVVVTREGWWDPRSGASARWVRLRRSPVA
ncbi:MAG: hypothetical protein ACI379_14925 [Nocardioides sp.]|uniref:hypothetical protein n=1 Tax=Nocardioides sp. TaxID=35761 RepID=UPI003F0C0C8C